MDIPSGSVIVLMFNETKDVSSFPFFIEIHNNNQSNNHQNSGNKGDKSVAEASETIDKIDKVVSIVSLSMLSRPFTRLLMTQKKTLTYSHTLEKGNLFKLIQKHHQKEGMRYNYCLRSCQYEGFVGIDTTRGELMVANEPHWFGLRIMNTDMKKMTSLSLKSSLLIPNSSSSSSSVEISSLLSSLTSLTSKPSTLLTSQQILQFASQGYLYYPQLISAVHTRSCIKLLNHYLGVPGAIINGGIAGGKFQGGIPQRPEIQKLLTRELRDVLTYLLFGHESGKGMDGSTYDCVIDTSSLQAQIAYRFPELMDYVDIEDGYDADDGKDESGDKMDDSGMYYSINPLAVRCSRLPPLSAIPWHTDGLRQGRAHSFSLLVGICLSDVREDYAGNLLVWPKSHHLLHQCKINQYGALDFALLQRLLSAANSTDSTNGQMSSIHCVDVPEGERSTSCTVSAGDVAGSGNSAIDTTPCPVKEDPAAKHCDSGPEHDNEPSNLPSLGEPISMHMNTGDVVILHADTAHAGGPNYSADIRRMIYFRVKYNCNPATNRMYGQVAAELPCELKAADSTDLDRPVRTDSLTIARRELLHQKSWQELETCQRSDMWIDLAGVKSVLMENAPVVSARLVI